MPIVDTTGLLREARSKTRAVPAFEVWNMESVDAVVSASERTGLPIILQVGPFEDRYIPLESLAEIVRLRMAASPARVALHLDHGDCFALAERAVAAGFNSVMLDASEEPYSENVRLTREVAEMAHAHGVGVEGEIGRVGGAESMPSDSDESGLLTEPEEAVRYAHETGVDFLAVAIGTAHGYYRRPPKLDLERLARIADAVPIPLVLHGGTGVGPDSIRAAIRRGIAKINICTEYVDTFAREFSRAYGGENRPIHVLSLFAPARAEAEKLVTEKLKLFALAEDQ